MLASARSSLIPKIQQLVMKERIQTHKVSPVGKDVTILSDQKKARPNFAQISYGGK